MADSLSISSSTVRPRGRSYVGKFNVWCGTQEDWPGISTERLRIVLPELHHAKPLADLLRDEHSRFAPNAPYLEPPSAEEVAASIERGRDDAQRGRTLRLILLSAGDEQARPIGTVELTGIQYGPLQQGYLGYKIAAEREGAGLMSEAVGAVIAFTFQRVGLHRIQAAVRPGNERSVRLLERLQFQFMCLAAGYLEVGGGRQDHNLYELTRPVWGQ